MTLKTPLLLMVALLMPLLAEAEPRRIVLQDGTQIVGELLSLKNGSYTIRSQTLGTIKISERQVASISSVNQPLEGSNPIDSAKNAMQGNQLQSIQQNLLNDSGMVQRIMQLQSNPDMQAVLNDPEIMSAIQRLDFEALRNNPKIQKLMGNREVQAISKGTN